MVFFFADLAHWVPENLKCGRCCWCSLWSRQK